MAKFICFTMRAGGRIKEIDTFPTEAWADGFARDVTAYSEIDPEWDEPDFWEKYDPPIVIVVESQEGHDPYESGKYARPVAIFQRGEKWVCIKETSAEGQS